MGAKTGTGTGTGVERRVEGRESLGTYEVIIVVVVIVVSHIQRVGCQPDIITLHGGQSRSWSAERGKENKKEEVRQHLPPPPSSCSYGRKK